MNLQEFLDFHEDNSMGTLDVIWVRASTGKYSFWMRDEHYEALKSLREADMLPVMTEEELPEPL